MVSSATPPALASPRLGAPPTRPDTPGATMPRGITPSPPELAALAARPDAMLPQLAPVTGNSVRLLTDEAEVLPEMLAAVRGAKQRIDFAMFSLADSGAGRLMNDALVERARAGVDVRVMLDQVGSMALPVGPTARMVERLEQAGATVEVNRRLTRDGLQPVDHRKLLVVDGTTAYTGGMNFSRKFGAWHDVMVRVDGPAAAQFGAHFVDRWVDVGGDAVAGAQAVTAPPASPGGGGRPGSSAEQARAGVALLVNHPGRELQASDHLLRNLQDAKERAWIMTPTLSDPAVVAALRQAAARGVDTRVAVSGPEGWIGTRALGLVGATFYRELVGSGVKVYEQPGMSHAKVSLVDDVASAGSLNMTRRAMLWDHELMLASDDRAFVDQVERLFETDFAKSSLVSPERANSRGARAAELLRTTTGLRW